MSTKFRREIGRIARQVRSVPRALFDTFFGTLYYDLVLSRRILSLDGQMDWKDKVAIFLVYPEVGVKVGHLESLKYMVSAGYSPILVSNCPLSGDDVVACLPYVSRIIIRPNYGYDFGGYRDAIRSIGSRRAMLKHLAIFNDSVWFPLPGSKDWLASGERMRVDFAGALAHAGPDWREAIRFAVGEEREKERYERLFHFCSFALLFSGAALKSDKFWKFWDHLKISSSKHRTVRNGERGLSKFMFEECFSHALSVTNFDIAYKLRHMPLLYRSPEVKKFEEHGGWPAYALPNFLWKEFGFMFLKKKGVNGEPLENIGDLEATVERLSRPVKILDGTDATFELLTMANLRVVK